MSATRPKQFLTEPLRPLIPVGPVPPRIRRRSELLPQLVDQAELDRAAVPAPRGFRLTRRLSGSLPTLPAFEIVLAVGLVVLSAAGAVY